MQRNIKPVLSFEKPTNSRDAQKIFDRVNKKKTELDEKKRTTEIILREKEEEISALQKMVDSLKREQSDVEKQLKQNDYECGVIVGLVKKLIDQEQQNQYSDRCRQYLMDHCIWKLDTFEWKNFDDDDDDDDKTCLPRDTFTYTHVNNGVICELSELTSSDIIKIAHYVHANLLLRDARTENYTYGEVFSDCIEHAGTYYIDCPTDEDGSEWNFDHQYTEHSAPYPIGDTLIDIHSRMENFTIDSTEIIESIG